MNPEKEIINWWLHKKGFFTMNSIRVAHNKEVDTFAICLEDGNLKDVMHIETQVSITPSENLKAEDYEAKFFDKGVVEKVNDLIEHFVGASKPYRKVLVLGLAREPKGKGIEVISFESILAEVILHLDKQNYRNSVVRTMQIVKYILMANPQLLASLLSDTGDQKILKQQAKERFVQELFSADNLKRIMGKEGQEEMLVSLLQESTLTKPERLADALLTRVLTSRTRKKFIRILLEHKEAQAVAKQMKMPKGMRSLQSFVKD
jgi:hypothetical protein